MGLKMKHGSIKYCLNAGGFLPKIMASLFNGSP